MEDRSLGSHLDVVPLLQQPTARDLRTARGPHADAKLTPRAAIQTLDDRRPVAANSQNADSPSASGFHGSASVLPLPGQRLSESMANATPLRTLAGLPHFVDLAARRSRSEASSEDRPRGAENAP